MPADRDNDTRANTDTTGCRNKAETERNTRNPNRSAHRQREDRKECTPEQDYPSEQTQPNTTHINNGRSEKENNIRRIAITVQTKRQRRSKKIPDELSTLNKRHSNSPIIGREVGDNRKWSLILECKIYRVCFFYNPGQDVCVDNLVVPSQLPQMKIVSFPHQKSKFDHKTVTPVLKRLQEIVQVESVLDSTWSPFTRCFTRCSKLRFYESYCFTIEKST